MLTIKERAEVKPTTRIRRTRLTDVPVGTMFFLRKVVGPKLPDLHFDGGWMRTNLGIVSIEVVGYGYANLVIKDVVADVVFVNQATLHILEYEEA